MNIIVRKFRSFLYHVRMYLFRNYAIPEVRNENISKALFKKYLPAAPVIIDCGAHAGKDSVELANMFSKGQVHAFEAAPEIFDQLKKCKSRRNNLFFYHTALADKNGEMNFYISEGQSDGSSSLLPPKMHLIDHPGTTFGKVIKVPAVALDDWAEKQGINHVDLLWLDMQGFELRMLQASEKILQTVSVIHTEVSMKETYEGVGQYEDLKTFLESKGFEVVMKAVPEGWDMGNVLFVRKTLKNQKH
ncbi:MAG: FkbM family methyltransferase [Chitinophagaceae bacterium]|nr:FkbM family methyltransferase [Chitinophagaceae bacterium]